MIELFNPNRNRRISSKACNMCTKWPQYRPILSIILPDIKRSLSHLVHRPVERHISHPLTRSTGRNTRTCLLNLSPSNSNLIPSPARARSAKNVSVLTPRHSSVNIFQSHASDGDSSSWFTSWATVFIILFNNNTVLGDIRQSDILICDTADGASGAADGFNANAVVGVAYGRGEEFNIFDDVGSSTWAATDGADGETVASGAAASGECDVIFSISKHGDY